MTLNCLFVAPLLAATLFSTLVASIPMELENRADHVPRGDWLTQFPSDPPNPITTKFIGPSQFTSSFMGPEPTGTPSSCTRVGRSNLFTRGYTPSKGDTFCFSKTTVTLLKQIGTNSEGSTFVWQLAEDNFKDYLIKIFSEADKEDVEDEATKYEQAQELSPLGIDLNERAFMIKWVKGQEIKDTNSYKAASDKDKFLDEKAAPLVLKDLEHFVCDYNILHKDLHAGNILFQESGTDLTQANLIDWGEATINPGVDCKDQDAMKKFREQQLGIIKKGLRR